MARQSVPKKGCIHLKGSLAICFKLISHWLEDTFLGDLAHSFNDFFVTKIARICDNLETMAAYLPELSFNLQSSLVPPETKLTSFDRGRGRKSDP